MATSRGKLLWHRRKFTTARDPPRSLAFLVLIDEFIRSSCGYWQTSIIADVSTIHTALAASPYRNAVRIGRKE
jgi:hypothetical protein